MSIDYEQIQDTIDYQFDNLDLLQQAFVRRSYSVENGGQNNEVLEFIGDKALDLAVIRLMMNKFGTITTNKDFDEFKLKNPGCFKTRLKEGQFTDIKKELVQKKYLAKCIGELGFHEQLIMGHGDKINNIQEQDSVKEDLFEAIIGAVTLDSNWDMDAITYVVDNMLGLDSYFNNQISKDNYVGLLQEWSQKHGQGLPDYQYEQDGDKFYCTVDIGNGICEGEGYGDSIAKSRKDAAYNVYNELIENGYIKNIYEEAVGEPSELDALRQLHELVQKELIPDPEFEFERINDLDGTLVWECTCGEFSDIGESKQVAKRYVAYKMLCSLMDYDIYY